MQRVNGLRPVFGQPAVVEMGPPYSGLRANRGCQLGFDVIENRWVWGFVSNRDEAEPDSCENAGMESVFLGRICERCFKGIEKLGSFRVSTCKEVLRSLRFMLT